MILEFLIKIFTKALFIIVILNSILHTQNKKLIDYVNPFIGTSNRGNTFPGAVVPWGMVSVRPHNSPGAPSGYIYGGKYFYGFGHTHLSGTGCADLGNVVVTAITGRLRFDPEEYKSSYSDEKASPGYYSISYSEMGIKAEATATARCGFLRFTSDSTYNVTILIDAGKSLNLTAGGSVKLVSQNEVNGSSISGGFCGEDNRQTIYFAAQFNQISDSMGMWVNGKRIEDKEKSIADKSIGGWISFYLCKGSSLLVKVGISYVSIKNAKENLAKEIPQWNFNEIKEKAENLWEDDLSRIIVTGNNENDKIEFYSALYHMLIHPNIINDVNGDYPLMGRKGIGNYKNRNRYTVFSLWDTYRTLHPFLTFVYPERQSEIIKTMIDMYSENGYLPKWELGGNETYMMVGDPAVPVIADSYIKGIKDFDANKALDAMLKPVLLKGNEKAPPVRAGYHELLQYKYIPFEQDRKEDWWVWGPVSTTLEYCLSDWAIAQTAKELKNQKYYSEFYTRSHYYKNLFDTTTLFMRPKLKNGSWLTPFDSLATEGSGDWSGSGGPGYVEGNAWNYTWFVPYDIPGLIQLFGSGEKFSDKLLRAFNENHFTINNEPDIAYPYLFTFVKGKEQITQELVSNIIKNDFGIKPDGLPGNDDCGAISGWFVFSVLGFYPACIASDYYQLGIPLFDKIEIKLNSKYYKGNSIIIEKKYQTAAKFIFNGKQLEGYQIKHSDLVKGGRLIFTK